MPMPAGRNATTPIAALERAVARLGNLAERLLDDKKVRDAGITEHLSVQFLDTVSVLRRIETLLRRIDFTLEPYDTEQPRDWPADRKRLRECRSRVRQELRFLQGDEA